MAWISIFKPVPPVCVSRFEPVWKWKLPLRSSRLASSGGIKNHGEACRNAAGFDDQVRERGRCPECVRVPRVRAAVLAVIFVCLTRLFWNQTFTWVSGPPRPPPALARLRDLLKRNLCSSSGRSAALLWKPVLGDGGAGVPGPADCVTVRAHAAAEPTGQARPGWKQGTRR